ncbi:RNA polymerase sigma-70 factor (ECF subfamily) [Sphingobacterium alimentarium]|uniref:RNA polymerase sigma-70 factor (ECF subfamily) n=1 Tax=Sphingobacterium alimentarium TaxID=797292 RepID=A0A4V2VUK1_9SPHI|nr:RNA polymerase sigma factor [Sphingobacterium alimentarium]TCV19965.1 RNA polymerase sigma-70 factor (ECF subfamily) [Sphingobacterium alimentarium]
MVINNNSLILEVENRQSSATRVSIVSRYFNRNSPLTLRSALEDCLVQQSDRSQSFLYKRFYGYMMAVSLRYVKNEMEAEDVVNESFVKVFGKLSNFQILEDETALEKSFKGWIARITVNTSIDKLRAQKATVDIDDINEIDIQHTPVSISTNLAVDDIMQLMNKLPDIQSAIFNLYEIEGYSHEEISKQLNIPDSTSRTYLTRAKARLRTLYQEQFEGLNKIKVG